MYLVSIWPTHGHAHIHAVNEHMNTSSLAKKIETGTQAKHRRVHA